MATSTINKFADGTDTGWITFDKTDKTYTGTVSYRKIGNVVYIRADGPISNLTAEVNFGAVQDECKPEVQQFFPIFAAYNVYEPVAYVRVYTGGTVQLGFSNSYTPAANTQYMFSVCYVV